MWAVEVGNMRAGFIHDIPARPSFDALSKSRLT
jgi:hypothetical protein